MRDEHTSFKIQNFQITGLVCVLFYRGNMSIFKICKSRSSLLSLICKVADSQRLYCFLSLLLLYITLSENNPVHRITYKFSHGGVTNMATEIWTVKDGKSYLLAYGGEEDV